MAMFSRRAPAPSSSPIVAAGLLPDDAAILRTVSRRTSFESGRRLAELGRVRSIMVSKDGRRISADVMDLYRPRLVGHLVAAYAARAAVESWSCRMALGGLKPCRSISQVAL